MWTSTSTESIRCAVECSTVSGVKIKNIWCCTYTAAIQLYLSVQHYLVLRLRMCGSAPLLNPYGVYLSA